MSALASKTAAEDRAAAEQQLAAEQKTVTDLKVWTATNMSDNATQYGLDVPFDSCSSYGTATLPVIPVFPRSCMVIYGCQQIVLCLSLLPNRFVALYTRSLVLHRTLLRGELRYSRHQDTLYSTKIFH